MKRWLPLLLFLLVVDMAPLASASSPVTKCAGWSYGDLAHGTLVSLPSGSCVHADSVWADYKGLGYVYFVNAANGTGFQQTFGMDSIGSSVTLTSINNTYVEATFSACSSCEVLFYYSALPAWVRIGATSIGTYSSNPSCTAPCVYDSGTYLGVFPSSAVPVRFYFVDAALVAGREPNPSALMLLGLLASFLLVLTVYAGFKRRSG